MAAADGTDATEEAGYDGGRRSVSRQVGSDLQPEARAGAARHYRAPGDQSVLHATALPGDAYDGHTLGDVIEATETLTGCGIERAYVDKGYRGHKTENPRRVFISGQKRVVFGVIKRELRRRSAIEPVIGHIKN